ncbi:MAG: hypothetical protein KDH96_03360 [Candidatus Riesia sp.]|nr:hypothetical protein [Candidatus Riesia sp.]
MVDGIRANTKKPSNVDFASYQNYEQSSVGSLFSSNSNKPSFENEGFRISDAFTRLSDGEYIPRYENFLQGTDNEDRLAREQETSNKWSRGITKFFGKTGTAILGGTVGSIYGIGDAIVKGDWEAIWDNDFYDVMDDWNKRMDNSLSNYYTQEERDMGFIESMGTANFWANDFLGGLSFTAGAVVSEAIWALATGGTSLATAATRWSLRGANALDKLGDATRIAKGLKQSTQPIKNYLSKMNGINRAKNVGKTVEGLNTLRYMYTSAGYEAGVEARAYVEEQKEAFKLEFENTYGRVPTAEEAASFEKNLSSTANSVFATNLALVGSSNLAIFGKMFNVSSPLKMPKSSMRKFLFGEGVEFAEDGTKKAINRNIAQRIAGTSYSVFKAPFIEGVYEEGLQAVTSTAAGSFLKSTYDTDENTLGLIEAVYEGLSHTYGTKEGFKEVGLGMLIGAFGGGAANIASGRNPFASVVDAASKTSKNDIRAAEVLNKYSSKKLANEIFRANGIYASNKEMQKAEQKGDLFHREAARTMGMMANIMYADRMGYGAEVSQEFLTEVENYDDSTLAKNLGITVEEAAQLKESAKSDYNSLSENYKKNKDFANYVIGRGKIKDETLNAELAREIIAYQMTMADKAEELSNDYAKAIMAEIGDFNTYGIRLKTFLEVQDTLRKGTKEDKQQFRDLQKKHKSLQRNLQALEKQRLRQESAVNSSREDNTNMAGALNNTTNSIARTQEELSDLEVQLEQAYAAMATYGVESDSNNVILGKDLANIEKNLEDIDTYFSRLKEKNPEKASRIQSMTNGYRSAIQGAKLYGEVIEDLLNPQTGLKGTTRTFLNSLKEYNDPTQRLVENLKRQQLIFASEASAIFADKTQNTEQNETQEKVSEISEDASNLDNSVTISKRALSREELDEIENKYGVTIEENLNIGNYRVTGGSVENRRAALDELTRLSSTVNVKTTVNMSPVQQIENKIKEVLRTNNYALQNFGENFESNKPTEKEVSRYEELLDRMTVNPDIIASKDPNKVSLKASNLTREEVVEFQKLNQKLSDWRIIDGVEIGGVSLTDLIKQKEAYKTEVNQGELDSLDENEELEVAIGVKNRGNRSMSSEMINTQENAVVAKINGKYELAHIDLAYFTKKGAVIKQNGNPRTNLENLPKGTYVIAFEDQEVAVKLSDHSRLVMDVQNFDKLMELAGFAVFNTDNVKGSNWNPVYELQEDGTHQPLKTTFTTRDVGSEINILDPQALYDLEDGAPLFFKLSLTDEFNEALKEEYQRAYWDYEANPSTENKSKLKSIEAKIFDEAHIYIVNENNDVVGQLKAVNRNVEEIGNFLAIRKHASIIMLDRYNPDTPLISFTNNPVTSEFGDYNVGTGQTMYTLPFTTTVTNVFAGSPNLTVRVEGNRAIVEKNDFNDDTIRMVKAFGVVENGQMIPNINSNINLQQVNSQFVSGITQRTPFAVIEYGSQLIAYPVSLKPTASDLIRDVESIYTSNMTPSEKAESLIVVLSEAGVDPRKYSIRHLDADDTFFGSPVEQQMLKDISEMENTVSSEKFLSKEYKIEDLKVEAQINVNLENKPFQNPKLEMNLRTEVLYTRQAEAEEVARFEITGVAEEITLESISNQLLTKKEEELSIFHKKVLDLHRTEIEKRVDDKLKLSSSKKQQSITQQKKNC